MKKDRRKRYGSYAWTDPKTKYLYARVRVKVGTKTKTIYKRALNLTHAKQLADEIKNEHDSRGDAYLKGRDMSLSELAEWYKENYVIPAVYRDRKKVEGMRTWKSERQKIERICEHIGHLRIATLDEDDLRKYKLKRLKDVSITTVNRDMESLRRMLRKAIAKRWRSMTLDFSELIDKSLEERRDVTITPEQFNKVLEHCKFSPELYALVLTLYDSGARPSEVYPVSDYGEDYDKGGNYEPIRWKDLWKGDEIVPVSKLTSMKGKVIQTRFMVVTNRMADALQAYWHFAKPDINSLVFPHASYKPWWKVAREAAGMPSLRLRDLRRDWVTRLAKKNFSDRLAQHGAGHKRMQQTFEYTVFDYEAALEAKKLLDS